MTVVCRRDAIRHIAFFCQCFSLDCTFSRWNGLFLLIIFLLSLFCTSFGLCSKITVVCRRDAIRHIAFFCPTFSLDITFSWWVGLFLLIIVLLSLSCSSFDLCSKMTVVCRRDAIRHIAFFCPTFSLHCTLSWWGGLCVSMKPWAMSVGIFTPGGSYPAKLVTVENHG
jgi:hypothetical protein